MHQPGGADLGGAGFPLRYRAAADTEPAGKSGLGQPMAFTELFQSEVGSHNNTILNKILSLAPIILRRDTLVNLHSGKNAKNEWAPVKIPTKHARQSLRQGYLACQALCKIGFHLDRIFRLG